MEIPTEVIICCSCNQPFAISRDLYQRLRECHNVFYCPSGHSQHFASESDTERLKRIAASRDGLISNLSARNEEQTAEIAKLKRSLKRAQAKSK